MPPPHPPPFFFCLFLIICTLFPTPSLSHPPPSHTSLFSQSLSLHAIPQPSNGPRQSTCKFSRFKDVVRCGCYVLIEESLTNRRLTLLCEFITGVSTQAAYFEGCRRLNLVKCTAFDTTNGVGNGGNGGAGGNSGNGAVGGNAGNDGVNRIVVSGGADADVTFGAGDGGVSLTGGVRVGSVRRVSFGSFGSIGGGWNSVIAGSTDEDDTIVAPPPQPVTSPVPTTAGGTIGVPKCTNEEVKVFRLINEINATLSECPLAAIIQASRSEIDAVEREGDFEEGELQMPLPAEGEEEGLKMNDGGYLKNVAMRQCSVRLKTAAIWLLTETGRRLVKRFRPRAFRNLPANYFQVNYGVRCFVRRAASRMASLSNKALRLLAYNNMFNMMEDVNDAGIVVRQAGRGEGNGIQSCKVAIARGRRRIDCVCRRSRT